MNPITHVVLSEHLPAPALSQLFEDEKQGDSSGSPPVPRMEQAHLHLLNQCLLTEGLLYLLPPFLSFLYEFGRNSTMTFILGPFLHSSSETGYMTQ